MEIPVPVTTVKYGRIRSGARRADQMQTGHMGEDGNLHFRRQITTVHVQYMYSTGLYRTVRPEQYHPGRNQLACLSRSFRAVHRQQRKKEKALEASEGLLAPNPDSVSSMGHQSESGWKHIPNSVIITSH